MHPTNVQTQFLTLRSQGLSYDNIVQQLHVSKHTLLKWARDFQPQIDALTAAQIQDALEKYQVTLIQRVEFLAQRVQHIQESVIHYDLRSSYTVRVFNLILKLHAALQKFDPLPIPTPAAGTETAPSINAESEPQNAEPPSTDSAPN